MSGSSVLAFVGGLLGSAAGVLVVWYRLRVERQQWREEFERQRLEWRSEFERQQQQWRSTAIVDGLDFLTGGTQKRSAGIGVLEALIAEGHVSEAVMPGVFNVLWNQLVYLDAKRANKDGLEPHELVNARRLVSLLSQPDVMATITDFDQDRYDAIRTAMGA